MLGEQVTVQEGQLDGIGYLLDLGVEPADVLVGDVGDFLQDKLFDLGPGQLLQQQPRAGVHEHRVAGPQLLPDQGVGQLDDPLLVAPAHDDGPVPVVQDVLHGDDLARQVASHGP